MIVSGANAVKAGKRVIILIFTFCTLTFNIIPQITDLTTQAQLWRLRAETITDNLIKETVKLSELDRALLFAELGDSWWKADPRQSDIWFEKSVDAIFFFSSDDTESGLSDLFQTSRKILRLIGSRNRKLASRLVGILSDMKKPSESDKDANANALVEYALLIVKQEPTRSLQMGELALSVGLPRELYRLVWELNRNNPKLAILLFNAALAKARNHPSYNTLQVIQISAFPEILDSNFPANLILGQGERVAALSFFAEFIIQAQVSLERQNTKCSNEASLVDALKNQFTAMLPTQAGIVQRAVNICLSGQSLQQQSLQATIKASTVEELLKLADEQNDESPLRTAYLYRAALLAYEEKRFALAIVILDGMDEKEKHDDLEFWEDIRASAAGFLAFGLYKEGDHQGWRKVLQDTPSPIRPFAQYGFIKQIPIEDISSYSSRVEILRDASKNLVNSEKSYSRKSGYWFRLIKLLAAHELYGDASDVLKDIATAFNNEAAEKSNSNLEISGAIISDSFTPELLNAQDSRLFEIVNLISKPRSRININLEFLKVVLQKYEKLNIDFSEPISAGNRS
ncbi:MAG TPA: hypothetical protein DEA22_06415 [Blastocatellia bacterium]|nr:hypothetical protein [Blastocatellia bacterium]